MTAEEAYNLTKEKTDILVDGYTKMLSRRKQGVWSNEGMAQYAPVDYKIFQDDELHHYLEVKCREHTYGHYEDEKVPISKYTFAYTFEHTKGIKSFLLVKWQDKVGLIDLMEPDRIEEMIARKERGDGKDLYAFYNYDKFTLLNI